MNATKQELMRTIGEAYSPYLETGKTYHIDATKGTYGGQQSGIYYVKDGKKYSPYTNLPKEEKQKLNEELRTLENAIGELSNVPDLWDLYDDLPADTKVRFTFIKGQPVSMKVYDVADLVLNLKEKLSEKTSEYSIENPLLRVEGVGHFIHEGDELSIAAECSEISQNSIYTDDSFYGLGIDLLNAKLDSQLKSIWFRLENDTLTVQTEPAFPQHGFSPIENAGIMLDPEYAKRKEAAAEAIRLRHEFYKSIGTLHDEVLYLNIGGFRDHNWPGYSTSRLSAKLRVIYTENTTIVITDGLSDIYADKHQDMEMAYNGTGAEYYIEFDSIVPFYKVRDHYMMAVLNSVTQVALGHGEFKGLIKKFRSLTLQFDGNNVETWVIKNNDANNDADTFFNSSQYSSDEPFGTLLTMGTKNLPEKLKLNIEEIVLVSVKPFGKKWFSSDKLSHPDEEVKTAARMAIIKGFEEDGTYNTIPVSYL